MLLLHHSDTTGNAIRCNTQQTRDKKAAHLCGICKLLQTPATHELSLVKRLGQRFESARRLFLFPIDKLDTQKEPRFRHCVGAVVH
jgi:hypothetical protein